MKKAKFIKQSVAALIIAAVAFAGCEDDPVKVTGVTLNKTTLTLAEGGSETLTATVTPADAENKAVTWSVTGDAATVDRNGKVTAVKAGEATIAVTTDDGGFKAGCVVTVTAAETTPVAVTGVMLNKTTLTLTVGASETLTAAVAPEDAANKTVTWTVTGGDAATVDRNGKVTAVKAGTATVTVTTEDGGFKAECTVTANEPTITMTTAMEGEVKIHLAGTGAAVIDWGDGSAPETVMLSVYDGRFTPSQGYTHTFSGITSHTLVVDGKNITHLGCSDMGLTALDVSNNTALTYLDCYSNQLASLNVSTNTALTYLSCDVNQLTNLNVTNNTALITLSCGYNQLTNIDVTKNTALRHLGCGNNQLTNLDVANNTALMNLYCYSNQLASLDVSTNTALAYLDCENNQLTTIDMTNNTALAFFECRNNQLEAAGLNALFGTLHSNPGFKSMFIAGNPGAAICNRTIATDKGWAVPD